jgi:hypothetical protein
MRRRQRRSSGWVNKDFHITLYLVAILFIFACAGASKIGTDLKYRFNKPAIAQKELTLISPIPSQTPKPTDTPNRIFYGRVHDRDKPQWERFVKAVDKVLPLYNATKIRKVVLAQGAHESGLHTDVGLSDFCYNRWNCLGIAAFTDSPLSAWYFENPEQMVIAYFERVIRPNFPEAWQVKDKDPDRFLYLLKYNSTGMEYATHDIYVDLIKSMPEWSQK